MACTPQKKTEAFTVCEPSEACGSYLALQVLKARAAQSMTPPKDPAKVSPGVSPQQKHHWVRWKPVTGFQG